MGCTETKQQQITCHSSDGSDVCVQYSRTLTYNCTSACIAAYPRGDLKEGITSGSTAGSTVQTSIPLQLLLALPVLIFFSPVYLVSLAQVLYAGLLCTLHWDQVPGSEHASVLQAHRIPSANLHKGPGWLLNHVCSAWHEWVPGARA